MSKFTDLVTARHNGVLHPQRPELVGFNVETDVSRAPNLCDKEYVVSLNFTRFLRVSGTIPEQEAAREAERGFKKELQYLVYSDLAPLVHNLREQIYRAGSGSRELDEAFQALQDEVMGR